MTHLSDLASMAHLPLGIIDTLLIVWVVIKLTRVEVYIKTHNKRISDLERQK